MAEEKNQPTSKVTASTQQYLNIAEIRDDTVVLKTGVLRAVLLVSSINFALKAEEEQNAIVQGYVTLLNSLDFSIQVVVQSRQLNIDAYLEELLQREQEETNELLRMQTASYRQYVNELVSLGEIMSKRFYAVVPYEPAQDKKKGFLSRLGEILSSAQIVRLKEAKFKEYKAGLDRRADQVMASFQSLGLGNTRLDTQGLIELFYNTYNPLLSQNEKAVEVGQLRVEA